MASYLALILTALACFRLTRLLVEDDIAEPLRLWIWARQPEGTFLGDLISCPWCASMWVGAGLTIVLWASGAAELHWVGWWMLPLGFSAVTGILSRGD